MDTCTQCGAELAVGRFCTNCGHPVTATAAAPGSWRTDTAERPGIAVSPADDGAHLPLYADEAAPGDDALGLVGAAVEQPRHRGDDARGGGSGLAWLVGLVVLALIGGFGAWLLVAADEEPPLARDARTSPTPRDEPVSDATPEPDPAPEPTRTRKPRIKRAAPTNLTPSTGVRAPEAAPASQDSTGNAVRYVATNMLDGMAETAWRMPGDGTGESITFRFDSPAVLKEVGLINGYAKVGQDSRGLLDWYAGNRRILEVEWAFDDGTVVTQALSETASVQPIPLDQVKTRSVTLRLLAVSSPGDGRASRDYTAISDVRLVGRPA